MRAMSLNAYEGDSMLLRPKLDSDDDIYLGADCSDCSLQDCSHDAVIQAQPGRGFQSMLLSRPSDLKLKNWKASPTEKCFFSFPTYHFWFAFRFFELLSRSSSSCRLFSVERASHAVFPISEEQRASPVRVPRKGCFTGQTPKPVVGNQLLREPSLSRPPARSDSASSIHRFL